jgi:hypothetical protein
MPVIALQTVIHDERPAAAMPRTAGVGARGLGTVFLAVIGLVTASPAPAAESSADAVHALYAASRERMAASVFPDPVHVESAEDGGRLQADIHSLVAHPFDALAAAFGNAAQWCSVLMLQPNVRQCRATDEGAGLTVRVGRRFDQPIEDAQPIDFRFEATHHAGSILQARLRADRGPVGTRDHLVVLEAVPVDGGQTFLRLHFSQSHGFGARLAARAYLATSGRDKVGFSSTGTRRDGSPDYIGGLRGAVERNAMRYYLAVDAVLEASDRPASLRFEASLDHWLDAIEQYPLQLAEDDRDAYRAAKQASS